MSLTRGGGPLSGRPAGVANLDLGAHPGHALYWEPHRRRIRGEIGGETLLDTEGGMLLHETGLLPVLYVPEADLRTDLLVATDHHTTCPFKGVASYRSIRLPDRTVENAVWSYPDPLPGCPPISGHAAVYRERLDHWYEEDEEVVGHLRDPYHRVDVRPSRRRVRVSLDGRVLAESSRPRLVFETGLPPRAYLPREDVDTGLLEPSNTVTVCAYKGTASHLSVRGAGEGGRDVAWEYPDPLVAAAQLAGCVAFSAERADVEIDPPLPG
ncbi:MAG TPA: DUF427 domain-containing protein [Candidatus Dormibacteraeota bacterium]